MSVFLLLLIAANVTASILETDHEIASRAATFFVWFERTSIALFTIEYFARLWACTADPAFAGPVRGRIALALTPMMLIDLGAIAPSYVDLFLPGILDLRFLRVLRLLRVFRLLRAQRVSNAFAAMVSVLKSKRIELGITLAIVLAAVLLASGAMYLVEHGEPNTQFSSIPRAMWWAIVTITTIGYGDMVPITAAGKVIAGFVAFVGICAIALPVGIVSSAFITEVSRSRAGKCATCGRDD